MQRIVNIAMILAGAVAALGAAWLILKQIERHPAPTAANPAPVAAVAALPERITPVSGGALVLIPAGSFRMGSAAGRSDEQPVHEVKLGAFYLDETPVTQAHYQRVMGENPARNKGPENPVEQVRWSDAVKFCNRCSELEGLAPCYVERNGQWELLPEANGYRLPTEAEWEYAARAGTTTEFFFGNDEAKLDPFGWFKQNTPDQKTKPVGKKLPNPWRLHEMVGNVWEWTNDWHDPAFYAASPAENPLGPATGDKKVLRGGSVKDPAKKCRHAYRLAETPDYGDVCEGFDLYGFRRARTAGR